MIIAIIFLLVYLFVIIKRICINGKQSSAANSAVSNDSKKRVKQILTKDPKNDYVAIINNDDTQKTYIIDILQASTRKLVVSLKDHTSTISCVAFNASSNQVLSGGEDKILRLWDLASGKLLKTFKGHTHKISCVTFNASGSQVLSGSFDRTLRLWDVINGQCLEVFARHNNSISCSAFNSSGSQIISGSYDGSLRLWDVKSGYCLRTFNKEENTAIKFVSFNASGTQVLSGSLDGGMQLWDVTNRKYRALPVCKGNGELDNFPPAIIPEQLLPCGVLPGAIGAPLKPVNIATVSNTTIVALSTNVVQTGTIDVKKTKEKLQETKDDKVKIDPKYLDKVQQAANLPNFSKLTAKDRKKQIENDHGIKSASIETGLKILATLELHWQGIFKLLDKLNNGDKDTKIAAIESLVKLGLSLSEAALTKVIEALLVALRNKSYMGLRDAAAQALGELSSRLPVTMLKGVNGALTDTLYTASVIPVAGALGKLSVRLSEADIKKIIDTFLTNLTEQHLHGVDAALALVELSPWLSECHINGLGEALVAALDNNKNEKVIYDIAIVLEKLINRLSDDDVVREGSKFFFTAIRSKHKFKRIYAPLVLRAVSSRLPEIALNELCEAFIIVLKNTKWYDSWLSPGGRVIAAQSLGELSDRLPARLLEEVAEALLITFENVSGNETSPKEELLKEALIQALEKLVAKLPESDLKKKSEASLMQRNFVTKPVQNSSNKALVWSANNQLSLPISSQLKVVLGNPPKKGF